MIHFPVGSPNQGNPGPISSGFGVRSELSRFLSTVLSPHSQMKERFENLVQALLTLESKTTVEISEINKFTKAVQGLVLENYYLVRNQPEQSLGRMESTNLIEKIGEILSKSSIPAITEIYSYLNPLISEVSELSRQNNVHSEQGESIPPRKYVSVLNQYSHR